MWWLIFPALIVLLLLLCCCVSAYLANMVVHWPHGLTCEQCEKREIELGCLYEGQLASLKPQPFCCKSPFGYELRGIVIPAAEGTRFPDGKPRVAVIVHGFGYTRIGSLKYADAFHKLGFICLLYDQRGHGETDRYPISMGYYEYKDLAAVCEYARRVYGEDCVLGTHGESMGAAVVMMHAPTDPKLSFVVEDCGYSSLTDEIGSVMHDYYKLMHGMSEPDKAAKDAFYKHLPRFPFVPLASLFSRLFGGVFYSKVEPKKAVAACPESLPMLFVHGDADAVVPFYMLDENVKAKRGISSVLVGKGANHAQTYPLHRVEYEEALERFLTENGLI